MRGAIVVALIAISMSAQAQPFDQLNSKEWLRLGVYYCITDRMVGIQGSKQEGQRYAGRITVDEPWAKFTVKTTKLKKDVEGRICRERLGKLSLDTRDLWFHCDAPYQVDFQSSTHRPPMRGDSSNNFQGQLWDSFNIFKDGTYNLFYSDYAGNSYLQEGRCESFKTSP